MSNLSALEAVDFQNKVLDSQKPVLVEFGATWCGPCKMLEPVLTNLAEDYDGQVKFYSVDVDQNAELAMTYGVMGVPTLILFRGGEPMHRLTGYRPKKALEKAFFQEL